jgi:hypothetical protein
MEEERTFLGAILYELQPFRMEDVRTVITWTIDFINIVFYELYNLRNFIKSLEIETPSWRIISLGVGWVVGYVLCIWMKFGSLYFILSIFLWIFLNLGKKQRGEASAYSVFNQGYERILGEISRLLSFAFLPDISSAHLSDIARNHDS